MAKRKTARGKVFIYGAGASGARRAFTLIELLVVLLILTLVIAITIPALGGARAAAKKSATAQLLGNLQKSIVSFQNENRRLPGYFTAQEMGHSANATPAHGFTAMENIMLDLVGGVLEDGQQPLGGTSFTNVGPGGGAEVDIDPDRIGTAGYFEFDRTNFVAQDGTEGGLQVTNWGSIPDLVDAWDNPILAWMGNESAAGPISEPGWANGSSNPSQLFMTRTDSGSNANRLAHFYWASNAGFLNSNRLGRTGKDQEMGSILGGDDEDDATESLMAVLGSPSNSNVGRPNINDVIPTAPRSSVFLHSAGADGVFFAQNDSRGRGLIDPGDPVLKYVLTWFTDDAGSNRLTNDDGQPTNRDLIASFDDITLSGGI